MRTTSLQNAVHRNVRSDRAKGLIVVGLLAIVGLLLISPRSLATERKADVKPRPLSPVGQIAGTPKLLHLATPAPLATPATVVPSPPQLQLLVTAYCPCKLCCGPKAHGVTASGQAVAYHGERFVAADTRLLPFGTRLRIPGYNGGAAVEVIDRGGAIRGNHIDVYFPTHQQALQWGKQTLQVAVEE